MKILLTLLLSALPCLAQMGLRSPAWVAGATTPSSGSTPSTLLNNLVVYYKMDEAGNGSRSDSKSTNTLTSVNTVESATGLIGNGANFQSANNEYFTAEDGPDWTFSTMTVAFWVNLTFWGGKQSGGIYSLCGKHVAALTDRAWAFRVTTNGMTLDWILSGNGTTATILTMQTNHHALGASGWHLIAGVVDGTKNWIFVDSTKQTNVAYSAGINDNTNQVQFGHSGLSAATGGFMDGIMDEVGVWSRALTSNEIWTLYNNGNGITYPFTGSP